MSDTSSENGCYVEQEYKGAPGYIFDPVVPVDAIVEEVNPLANEQDSVPPLDTWCHCKNCAIQPRITMNTCCADSQSVEKAMDEAGTSCIRQHPMMEHIFYPVVLDYVYSEYCHQHENLFPDDPTPAQIQARYRLCCYRIFTKTFHPRLRQRERIPLPACVYDLIHQMYPPDDNVVYSLQEYTNFSNS